MVSTKSDLMITGTSIDSLKALGDLEARNPLGSELRNPDYDRTERYEPFEYLKTLIQKNLTDIVAVIVLESASINFGPLKDRSINDLPKYIPSKSKMASSISFRYTLNGKYTLATELSIICGHGKIKRPKECIPLQARELGYTTHYYHTNDLSFYSRRSIMRQVGFQNLVSAEEEANQKENGLRIALRCIRRAFCAPPDNALYQLILSNDFSEKRFILAMNIDLQAHIRQPQNQQRRITEEDAKTA